MVLTPKLCRAATSAGDSAQQPRRGDAPPPGPFPGVSLSPAHCGLGNPVERGAERPWGLEVRAGLAVGALLECRAVENKGGAIRSVSLLPSFFLGLNLGKFTT